MEEPSTTGLTSPGGGLHDEGDPNVDEAWDATVTLSGLAKAGVPARDALSSAAQGPPTVAEQASSAATSTAGVVLGRSV